MFDMCAIRERIRQYKLKKILDSGENDMFDDKIDRKKIEEALNEDLSNKSEVAINLKKTVEDMDNLKLYKNIINLKERIQDVE